MTKNTAQVSLECLKAKNVIVLQWPSQSTDFNPVENLKRDLKIAILPRRMGKIAVSRCAKPVETYSKRFATVIVVEDSSTKY